MNETDKTQVYLPDGDHQVAPEAIASVPSLIGRYRVEKILGQGGFGIVYLGYDDQLQRPVAIKVPNFNRIGGCADVEAYLIEARTVANLDHPNIVPVHDVGSTDAFPCFVVSKFIDGTDLATKIKQTRFSVHDTAELVATVAEALQYAHLRGLVHRDIKPGNILLDQSGRPFVADFGLALRDQDLGKGPRYAGTPAYMSPEQARGEGHRVDGRSDIFSLGVIYYELLTGKRPFKGDTQRELLDQITTIEPRPVRQIEETIPKEIERICLRALAKRSSERYLTAKDLAEDLRHFLARGTLDPNSAVRRRKKTESANVAPVPTPAQTPGTESRPVKIVPKGLRSFDASDADFFLELLPGPRDRDGLPESIRCWKNRVASTDPDATFSVGLIYGPSGCGKSSLVKAGLLPRISKSITVVYVEATGEDTEARLLKSIRRQVSGLPESCDLIESLAELRRGRYLQSNQKVLLVLDQFEQWLHARRFDENPELVKALRHCDGCRVQCLILVRDDFWLAISRFMQSLEVRAIEGENSRLIDLFDSRHARNVLAMFGRALGTLPEGQLTSDQAAFLDQAVADLAQDGKIISVRLALFAEMVKGKSWKPSTLKELGGTEGVGVAFLEETFVASTAPPEHRLHRKAAQAVLKALLPDPGMDIKGHMRSDAELLQASGYESRPKEFAALLEILDSELRLITPTDPEGKDVTDRTPALDRPRQQYYQLTHDYLVHSLRDWLTRKQKETRRGRAELLLADRATIWTGLPENRQLPSLWQWFQIRLSTRSKDWTPPQRKMMARAGCVHARRWLTILTILGLLGWGGIEGYGRLKANTLCNLLLKAPTAKTPAIIQEMRPYRRWVNPILKEAYTQAKVDADAPRQLHASLALLPEDAAQVEYLYQRMLEAEPQEILVIRQSLLDYKSTLLDRLWSLLDDSRTTADLRLRAASGLAAFAPDDSHWTNVAREVAEALVVQKPFMMPQWAEALRPIGKAMAPALTSFLVDENRPVSDRGLIAAVYGIYAANNPEILASLQTILDERYESGATVKTRVDLDRKQASIAVALAVMGHVDALWQLMKLSPDPTLRSYLIDRVAPMEINPSVLLIRLKDEPDVSVQRAIILSLGNYGLNRISYSERELLTPQFLDLYKHHSDPGIHSAVEWLLRQWDRTALLTEIDRELATGQVQGNRQWYLNRQSQTMIVTATPEEFTMGETDSRVAAKDTIPHRRRIDRSYAIAANLVTGEQFLRFRNEHKIQRTFAPTDDCPVNQVNWFDAAAYCNWLSEQEGISRDQWCYEPNQEGKFADGMKMADDYLKRTGYRLPTEAEWEYACRAGTATLRFFGEADDLHVIYGWTQANALGRGHPVGSLKPNDLGLFDLLGNSWNWSQDLYMPYPKPTENQAIGDSEQDLAISKKERVMRGGSYLNWESNVRSAGRRKQDPMYRYGDIGFRVARTMPPATSQSPTNETESKSEK